MNIKVISLLVLTLVTSWQGANASGLLDNTDDAKYPGLKYFKEDAEIIKQCLSTQKQAELHFFWTTGRDPSMVKPEYGASQQVDIGGAKYAGQKFLRYVDELLAYSPNSLNIKFVCDTLTLQSNHAGISNLQDKYPKRFEILDVSNIHDNLLKAFPNEKEYINVVFQNATCGNPAITSDIYRLVGMIYGREVDPAAVLQTQYTYCDIDAFCSGMDTLNQAMQKYLDFESYSFKEKLVDIDGYTNLLKALFAPPTIKPPLQKKSIFMEFDPSTTFYLGRKKEESNGNDLIKLCIISLDTYKNFCRSALCKMDSLNKATKNGQSELTLLTYFPSLCKYVKECENDAQQRFSEYLDEFSKTSLQIKEIINVTGPGLVDKLDQCLRLEQTYPHICAWEWHGTQLLENGESARNTICRIMHPQASKLISQVYDGFENYNSRVSDAFFARKFGVKHPFYVKMVESLQDNFPYTTKSFKTFLKEAYDYQKNNLLTGEPIENWLGLQIARLTKGGQDKVTLDSPYYVKLNHILHQLGIKISLTPEMIDFRK